MPTTQGQVPMEPVLMKGENMMRKFSAEMMNMMEMCMCSMCMRRRAHFSNMFSAVSPQDRRD